jgi:hypothetical protein
VSVRLKIEDSREGLVATISQRDDAGNVIGLTGTCFDHQAFAIFKTL